jgi:protein SCO1/2
MNLKRLRLFLWVAVGIVALAGLWIALRAPSPQIDNASSELPLASIGGPFTLVGSDGKPFSSTQLSGRPFAIFFGFTNCPDVCPNTLARLAKLRRQLGKGDAAFDILFVSVDPERDGPAEVGAYSKLFGTPVIGLTGSQAQVEQVKKSFGIYSVKVEQPGGGYSVDHTATTLLMDKAGRFVATIAPEEPDSMALDKLRRIAG